MNKLPKINPSLKLSDSIEIKNLLVEKLHREMQGFRTSPSEYKELDKVNPQDIMNIIQNIKKRISNK
jgi:hypothetical protein